MGMYDESWCNGCGKSQPYSDKEEVYCGECAQDNVIQDIISFCKGRIAELTELREKYEEENDYEMDDYTAGCIDAYDIIRIKLEK